VEPRGEQGAGSGRRAPSKGRWREHDILVEAEAVAHVGAWVWHITTGDLWWSDEVYRIFGLEPQEFPATYEAFLQHVHPGDRAELEGRVAAAVAGTADYDITHRVMRPSGDVRVVRERGKVSRDAGGSPVRMLGVVHDITDEHALRQALADSEARYRLLTENAYDVIWTMELDGTISYISAAVERVRGFTPTEARHQSLDQIHPPESAARVAEYFGRLFAAIESGTEPPTFLGEQEYYRKDGSIMHGEVQVIPQTDADGNVVRILGVTRDISDRRRLEEELNRLAVTDPLTGVWNRRQGQQLLDSGLAEARRYGTDVSLLMLDIDHFKAINDEHGHQVGDAVLVELCRRLSAHLRPSDALVRWGGEEFVILARHTDLDAATSLAEKLRALVAATPLDGAGTITVSIGVAHLEPSDDVDRWLFRVDQAMYEAKAAGRNAVRARG
jgi:diguanylate cyclase (GGDEF)-like protein/PAS domain S-box-containing protein